MLVKLKYVNFVHIIINLHIYITHIIITHIINNLDSIN